MRQPRALPLGVMVGLTSCVIRLAIRSAAGHLLARARRSALHASERYYSATEGLFSRPR